MAIRPAPRAVLSLQGAALTDQHFFIAQSQLDLELARGQLALVQVPDDDDGAALVDLCLGAFDPPAGQVSFLGTAWHTRTYRERLHRRRRIGALIRTQVWPAHLSVLEASILPRSFHYERPREELLADATRLARQFGLPGLPADRREATSVRALLRAGCVRGFLGTPDLVLIRDQRLDAEAELGAPMAQAIGEALDRGGAVLWIVESLAAPAARYVAADMVFRLEDRGLVPARRRR